MGDHPPGTHKTVRNLELEACLRLFSSTQDHDQEDGRTLADLDRPQAGNAFAVPRRIQEQQEFLWNIRTLAVSNSCIASLLVWARSLPRELQPDDSYGKMQP